MKQGTDYITEEKKKELEHKLEELKGPKRRETIEALEYAKSLGDLSENAEYHQAREDQGKLEAEIKKIEHILATAVIAKPAKGGVIGIGSRIIVVKDGSKEETAYCLVGSEESNMKEGKISNRSPFGEALFGKKKGDKITFQTPKGEVNYKIIDVS